MEGKPRKAPKKGQFFVRGSGLVRYRRKNLTDNRRCYRPFLSGATRDKEVCLTDEQSAELTPLRTWVWKTQRGLIAALALIVLLVIISLIAA